jgi:hypothetical protein
MRDSSSRILFDFVGYLCCMADPTVMIRLVLLQDGSRSGNLAGCADALAIHRTRNGMTRAREKGWIR